MTDLMDIATFAVEAAQRAGADDVAVGVRRSRFIDLEYRDEQLEKITESTSSGLGLALFVDGRYSSHGTSDLRREAVEKFIGQAVDMTRLLGEDPHRGLADPELYKDRPTVDLERVDPNYGEVDTEARKAKAQRIEAAAQTGDSSIVSVTAGYYDTESESVKVHSNGFSGRSSGTQFWMGAQVSVDDDGGKKQRGSHWVGARHYAELADPDAVGAKATELALRRKGQIKMPSGNMTLVMENRAAPGLLRHLLSATSGAAIQQERSFLLDMLGKPIGSDKLTLIDDPLIPRGFGSRHYDGDGISARRRTLVDAGELQMYLIDVYYGRKLGVAPTGGGTSNLILAPGERDCAAIVADIDHGVLVTGFLGGNSDGTRGDFSLGIVGFEIDGGKLGAPVGEMNITGNHRDLWHRLVEVGNDPWPYTSSKIPTLVLEDVAVSGA